MGVVRMVEGMERQADRVPRLSKKKVQWCGGPLVSRSVTLVATCGKLGQIGLVWRLALARRADWLMASGLCRQTVECACQWTVPWTRPKVRH